VGLIAIPLTSSSLRMAVFVLQHWNSVVVFETLWDELGQPD